MVLNTEWAQVEVIDLINDGSGLAFGIIGGRSTGVVVKTILPGGVADRDGRLQSGDHILQIGEVNLRGLGSEQVASVLRQCGVHVRMVVARPVESATLDIQALTSQAPIVPTKVLGDPVELDRHLMENGFVGTCAPLPPAIYTSPIYGPSNTISDIVDVVRDPLPIGKVPKICPPPPPRSPPSPQNLIDPESPETETFTIELKKDDLGLGITVAGYVCEKEEISGIFVKSISKGSAADLIKSIQINDRIIEVNGTSVIGFTNHQAVELLKNTGDMVKIKFERYLRGPKYEQLQQAIKANELRPPSPPSPTISSLPKVPFSLVHMSYLGIEPEGESRTSIDFDSTVLFDSNSPAEEEEEKEIVIDGGKSLQFSIASRESIQEKWKGRIDKQAEIVIAQMEKPDNSGLGISLEGTVDVEDGKEVRPHHYIRNILPDGPVGSNRVLQSGDELLEVNGIQLLGLNHLEVVAILKQLPNFVSLVCARYPVPIRIIDTSQHPDAFQARKILAGSLQTLIQAGEQNRLVKAKSETSIASSVGSEACTNSKSRSLEFIAGLPMWCEDVTVVELLKGDHGLGFSILDYQDPLNPNETVIVIRSLVPGGVAQVDGRLIPGDRLLAVNDVNVERSALDVAVQVLKGAPKGVVKIAVAKPLNGTDAVSDASQGTDDDHTCLEDFQECIEDFQEDLITVPIFIEDDKSFNHSPSTSQVEDLGQKRYRIQNHVPIVDLLENNYLNIKDLNKDSIGDSDIDISFKSTNDNCLDHSGTNGDCNNIQLILKNQNQPVLEKMESLTQSERPSLSDKDGYETCMDDSLSEDNVKEKEVNLAVAEEEVIELDDVTPTNSNVDLIVSDLVAHHPSSSTPCIPKNVFSNTNDLKMDGLKSYDDRNIDTICESDEFFLVQYPSEKEVCKSMSEPNVLETTEIPVPMKLTYKLREYYNDYENCLDAYKGMADERGERECVEMTDSQIFNEIFLPFKSRSAPDVIDRSFVTMTYDPGPDLNRRKSAFMAGYPKNESDMAVIRQLDSDQGSMKGNQEDVVNNHWGSTHLVKVFREPNQNIGISIVGGKVDVQQSEKQQPAGAFLGIFVKNVTPGSPAAKTGQFKTGDRILEVSGIDLREATHDKAVEAIRSASNPVVFLVQSLIPWSNTDIENNINNEHNSPSPPSTSSKNVLISNQTHLHNHDDNDNIKQPSPTEKPAAPEPPPPSVRKDSNVQDIPPTPIRETVDKEPIVSPVKSPTLNTVVTIDVSRETNKSPIILDESGSDDEEMDTIQLEGRTVSAKGQQIDRASAANIRRSKEEIEADKEEEDDFGYTTNKVKKKYGNLGHNILMVQLERGSGGLGLSLAGHRDRSCMAVFVCGLNPNGAAYKTGSIEIGDEILEVNGVVLHGRCHLNASAIIKSLSGPVFKVIILRRKAAIDDIAVKPITQFPVSLAEEASEEHFSANYPNVRTVAIKKAGLEIGEMILAVNKDSLVGSNYDTAANLLKRTEGLVTLVVSNPSKKDPSRSQTPTVSSTSNNVPDTKSQGLKTSTTPSRPTTPVPEPAADPLTCSIIPGRETNLELNTNNETLGIFIIGGKDTVINDGIILMEVYPGGAADKDGRLQPGDQILEVNGASLRDCSSTTASQALRQALPKMKITVFRPNNLEYVPIEVELVKKPGKGLGLSVVGRKSGKGVYIADIVPGGTAEADGKITRGDLLVSVNGQNVENVTSEEAGAILKTVTGRVVLKLNRYKPSTTKVAS
ncbi:multiple PDZ domain protein-like isoform X4 [Rhynchophorus ferrugineus]|uniref:multiple PDZ domain protein-like isoform X4 n=1 Tax=Rhynchophorus ferrugineus TaxID=354439 RepID=UPI003FCC8F12